MYIFIICRVILSFFKFPEIWDSSSVALLILRYSVQRMWLKLKNWVQEINSFRPLFCIKIHRTKRHSEVIFGQSMVSTKFYLHIRCKIMVSKGTTVSCWYLYQCRRNWGKTREGSTYSSPPPPPEGCGLKLCSFGINYVLLQTMTKNAKYFKSNFSTYNRIRRNRSDMLHSHSIIE